MITLEEFKKIIQILSNSTSHKIRENYISMFINQDMDHFKKYIKKRRKFTDGLYYTAHLWDCLKYHDFVKEKEILDYLSSRKQLVYVMWDLHSSEMIPIKNYWKFPKSSVLELNSNDLVLGLNYLPTDIYIFDRSMEWTLILTHEYDNQEDRICFKMKALPL